MPGEWPSPSHVSISRTDPFTTKIDRWFLEQIKEINEIVDFEEELAETVK